jgi:acetyl esterase/lipase
MRLKMFKISFALLFICPVFVRAQEIINLYPGMIPNSKTTGVKEVSTSGMFRGVTKPTLEIYLPEKEKATGTAVVICPGGGYSVVVYQGEGISTAKEFAKNGVAAFVIKYRLPDDSTMLDKKIGPLQDTQQAIKVVRENAVKWGIDPAKIGIMGFSAGGHLASTEATHFKKVLIENDNNTNLRPDFQILVYPVISMQDKLTHLDSRTQLLGKNPPKDEIDQYSNEMQVDENTPSAYITHASDDQLVDVDNSIYYFEQLRKHKVPVEMHIYQKGGHGFIFRHEGWMNPLFQWMKDTKLIPD